MQTAVQINILYGGPCLQMGNPMTPQIAVGVSSVLTSDRGQFSTLANVTILPVTTSYVVKRWKKETGNLQIPRHWTSRRNRIENGFWFAPGSKSSPPRCWLTPNMAKARAFAPMELIRKRSGALLLTLCMLKP